MGGSTTVTVADLERFFETFNRHDLDGICAFFTEDVIYDSPRGPNQNGQRFEGREQVRDYYARFFGDLPDATLWDLRHWVSGERGASEWTLTATTPAGTRMEVRGCDLFEFRDGRIARKDTYLKQVR